jgi:transposase
MSRNTLFVGSDLSKDICDIYAPSMGYEQFANDIEGFKSFKKWLNSCFWCVMENTVSYHQQLAAFLPSKGIQLSVVNELDVKGFIHIKLQRYKTDLSDAKMIALYRSIQTLEIGQPDPE